jgi:CheY-like chemotaxis protein
MGALGASQSPAPQRRPPTLLVVDDEVVVRLCLAEAIRDAGYLVLEAANADEALAILQGAGPVDLMVTDVQMPGSMDGLGLAALARIRAPDLKLVLVSAAAVEAGELADAFFPKPYRLGGVLGEVQRLLAHAHDDD